MALTFHAYPSTVLTCAPYDRSHPMPCDTVEFDTTGCFDPLNFCFVAPDSCIVAFRGNAIWQAPVDGAALALLLYKNSLPLPGGASTGEIAGIDATAHQPGSNPIGLILCRTLALVEGDKIWLVPCINSGGPLTSAVNGGYNTCNYFEGEII